jgi:GNAT superfamily N-acetyltransferase
MPLRIRASVPDDAESIADVQVRSFQAGMTYAASAEQLAALDPAPRVPLWRERQALVAEDEQGIVGVAEVGPSSEACIGEIIRFFVAPERWGKGVAQALMAHGLEQLRASDLPQAILWVHAENGRARGFYESGGWRPDGAEKDQETFGQPLKMMRYRRSTEP